MLRHLRGVRGAILWNVRIRAPRGHPAGACAGAWRLLHHMDVRAPTHPPDRLIARVAARQSGVVARHQLVALGLSRGSIEKRLAAGACTEFIAACTPSGIPRCRGRPAHGRSARLRRGSGRSHRSAGERWGIHPWNGAIEVTTPTGRGRRVAGVHRAPGGAYPPGTARRSGASRSPRRAAPWSTSPMS